MQNLLPQLTIVRRETIVNYRAIASKRTQADRIIADMSYYICCCIAMLNGKRIFQKAISK